MDNVRGGRQMTDKFLREKERLGDGGGCQRKEGWGKKEMGFYVCVQRVTLRPTFSPVFDEPTSLN